MSRGVVLAVRVTPRSNRESVDGADGDGMLRLRVTAPPADGAANAAVVKVLAKAFGVPRGAVSIASGARSRRKRVRIEGVDVAALRARWPDLVFTSDE